MGGYWHIWGKPGQWYAEAWMGNRPRSEGGPFATGVEVVKWLSRRGVSRDSTADWLAEHGNKEVLDER